MIVGLILILFIVLFLPVMFRTIERNLEVFLFVVGVIASVISHTFSPQLVKQALQDPIKISVAVLVTGLLFRWFQRPLHHFVHKIASIVNIRLLLCFLVIIIGIISSVITAIIAALLLVTFVQLLPIDRKSQIKVTILGCFSIGIGAALTPIGEPLSTVIISKLHTSFYYLITLAGREILLTILLCGIFTFIVIHPILQHKQIKASIANEHYEDILVRAVKVYFFVMGLTLLGTSFEPIIQQYLLPLPTPMLYWINMISAVLDNATLASAEISNQMNGLTIKVILIGLLISGGMLIPGNIPNIIAADKLNITSKEWAKYGMPIGMILMTLFYWLLL